MDLHVGGHTIPLLWFSSRVTYIKAKNQKSSTGFGTCIGITGALRSPAQATLEIILKFITLNLHQKGLASRKECAKTHKFVYLHFENNGITTEESNWID